jgi:transmembrane sensor
MDPSQHEQTLLVAARWQARLHAADCSPGERAAFEEWRQADPVHAQAFALSERVTDGIDHLQLVDPRFQALLDEALQSPAEDAGAKDARRQPRHWAFPATFAAGLACAMIALRFLPGALEPEDVAVAYESQTRAARIVQLEDGSIVQLDVASRMLVSLTPQYRKIELLSGRAMFDVAHDKSRPFSVSAASSKTTALGTRFEVDLQSKQVVVTLAEGAVAVDNEAGARTWQEQLLPGEQLKIDRGTAVRSKSIVEPQLVTSWTQGRHAFRGTPLQQALDEVNRYSQTKIRLGDPTLAQLPVAGNFVVGDSEAVVSAFAALLPLRVVASGDDEVILFRRYDDAIH